MDPYPPSVHAYAKRVDGSCSMLHQDYSGEPNTRVRGGQVFWFLFDLIQSKASVSWS